MIVSRPTVSQADVLSGRASDDMGDTGVATSVDGDPDSRILFCGQIEGNVDVSIFEDQTGSLTELWTWFDWTPRNRCRINHVHVANTANFCVQVPSKRRIKSTRSV